MCDRLRGQVVTELYAGHARLLKNIGILAMVVLIRTFLSLTLEVGISGKWPWQDYQQSVCRPGRTDSHEDNAFICGPTDSVWILNNVL